MFSSEELEKLSRFGEHKMTKFCIGHDDGEVTLIPRLDIYSNGDLVLSVAEKNRPGKAWIVLSITTDGYIVRNKQPQGIPGLVIDDSDDGRVALKEAKYIKTK